MSDEIAFNAEVDAVGLNCPLPILRTKKMLATMQSGEVVKVRATDAGAAHDFPAFAKQTGNELVASYTEGNVLVFFLKRRQWQAKNKIKKLGQLPKFRFLNYWATFKIGRKI